MLEKELKAVAAAAQPSLRAPNLHASTTSNQLDGDAAAGSPLLRPRALLSLATMNDVRAQVMATAQASGSTSALT